MTHEKHKVRNIIYRNKSFSRSLERSIRNNIRSKMSIHFMFLQFIERYESPYPTSLN